MNKSEARKKYGKERCQTMHQFLSKISRNYAFPYSDESLFDFLEDLAVFTKNDLQGCLKALEDRKSKYPPNFNEIKVACKDARSFRRRFEKMEEGKKEKDIPGCPMPEKLKNMVENLKEHMTNGDPTSKGVDERRK